MPLPAPIKTDHEKEDGCKRLTFFTFLPGLPELLLPSILLRYFKVCSHRLRGSRGDCNLVSKCVLIISMVYERDSEKFGRSLFVTFD